MRHLMSLLVPISLLAACGGDDDSSDEAPANTTTDITDTTDAPAATEPTTESDTTGSAAEPAATEPAPTGSPATDAPAASSTLPEPAAWDAPTFDVAIAPLMDDLASGIGLPLDPATALPGVTVPVPGPANVTGAGVEAEVDGFDGSIDITYSLGLDLAIDPAGLETWAAGPIDGWTSPSFAESGSLYTALLTDPQGQRLVYVLDTDPATNGRPGLNAEWAPVSDTMPDPEFLASLPRPDGGVLTELNVARGLVTSGFMPGLDGNVFVRFDYEPTDLEQMVDYFEQGVLVGAGFTYEPTPLSNTRYRRDVSIGDWEGQVAIGEVTSGDQLVALQVIWNLSRS